MSARIDPVTEGTAGTYADEWVARVRDDPRARLALLRRLYEVPPAVDRGYLPYRRAASAFIGWQLRRGLLNPETDASPGSPWWRAVNEALLRDTCEASAIAFGRPGAPRTPAVAATLEFIRKPTARTWYRAHNLTIATAYVDNEELARHEVQVERFFINLVLVRVLYAHALVANPRLGMTAIFLSLSRVLPATYPLEGDLSSYVDDESSLGHLLDVGIIVPRVGRLYDWSASELGLPELRRMLDDQGPTPSYAWDPADAEVWHPAPSRLARAARRVVSASP